MAIDKETPMLVILAFDVGDPVFIERWSQEGYLPTLASIMKRGCWGRTSGPELISEHSVWISLFSGISVGQHGYYSFRQLKPGIYDLQLVTGLDAGVRPFWSHLARQDKRVAIIDVPDFYPSTGIAGIHLADWSTHNPSFPPSAEPPELLQDVRQVFGHQMKIDEKLNSSFREDQQIYRRLLERVEKAGALCRHLLARDQFHLVVVVFSESHTAGHQFWKYRPQAQVSGSKEEENELTHAIRDIYQAIDRQMGLLLAQVSRDANVCIFSSTGLKDHYPTTRLIEDFCQKLGYQASPEPAAPSLRPLALIRRTVPEAWRIALTRHLPRETRERLLADQFRDGTNWKKTTAFPIPSFYTSFLRVNLRGREPDGIVEQGADYKNLLDRLEADLKQLIDPETGEPAVERVARTVELFGVEPPLSLPDLFVIWKPAAHLMRRVVHPQAELVQQKPEFFRGSDHSEQGFFAAAGPSIQKRGAIGDVSLLNLAPTFLSLMDEPIPQELTGKALEAILKD